MAEVSAHHRVRVPLELSIPRLLGDAGYRVRTSPASQRRLHLYDTADGRLAAAGAELSRSVRDGWTWRRSALGHPKLTTREWTAPPAAAVDQVMEWTRAFRRGEDLEARATVVVHRRTHHVDRDSTDDIVTLVEERVDQQREGRWAARVRRIDVTSSIEGRAAGRALGLIEASATADAATLALLDPTLVQSPRLQLPDAAQDGSRELFLRSAGLSMIQWLYLDCEVSGGGAPEALRKMRVALRRLRSDLQTFAPLLDRDWANGLREQLGGVAAGLGVVRDAEVLMDRLGGLVALLPVADQDAGQGLLDIAGAQLATARAELMGTLADAAYVATVEAGLEAALAPRWSEGSGIPAVSRLARRPWRRLRGYVMALEGTPDDVQMHRIRILAKRTRYAAEACIPAVGTAAATSAAHLAHLQTVLGEHHDAAVTREWLLRQAASSGDLAFAAGQVAGLELRRLGDARQAWPQAWAQVARRRGWRWLGS